MAGYTRETAGRSRSRSTKRQGSYSRNAGSQGSYSRNAGSQGSRSRNAGSQGSRSRSSGSRNGNAGSQRSRNSAGYSGGVYKKSSGRRKRSAGYAHTRRRNKRRNQQIAARIILFLAIVVVVSWAVIHLKGNNEKPTEAKARAETANVVEIPPDFEVQLLDINDYSRPAQALEHVNGIVIHYTANPGTTAKQNRDYFNGLKDTGETKASSHFIVGIEGEIIQCIPTAEIAYASNERNSDTIAIECCIEDDTGKFNDATYQSLVHLVAWLCGKFELNSEDVIRHYDVTGKNCPKYFVEHEDAWQQFKEDVRQYIDANGTAPGEQES